MRADELSLDYGTDEMLDLDMPTRFRIPSHVNPVLVGDRLTEYADVDMNRHMNNTHYPDILCGYIPEISGNRVISMTLNFVNEAPLGERIKIYSGKSDGSYYFRTKRPDGKVNVEAEFILEEI